MQFFIFICTHRSQLVISSSSIHLGLPLTSRHSECHWNLEIKQAHHETHWLRIGCPVVQAGVWKWDQSHGMGPHVAITLEMLFTATSPDLPTLSTHTSYNRLWTSLNTVQLSVMLHLAVVKQNCLNCRNETTQFHAFLSVTSFAHAA